MKKPGMIVFDYGHTLLYEPGYDFLSGERALFPYIKGNKRGLTPEYVNSFAQELFGKLSAVREIGFEIHEWQFQKLLYEYLEIEFSIDYPEAEKIFWDSVSYGDIMPRSDMMIDYINANGIRSGVISNIGFSGAALTERINRLLPRNRFEFIIASSEYALRKPNPMLFELALKKADLCVDEVWFCGDNVKADVEGAASVGIFPVWYEDLTCENPWRKGIEYAVTPVCSHLHVNDWTQMIEMLETL